MFKQRRLSEGQQVVLIYDAELGFIQQSAIFKEYRIVKDLGVNHEAPFFDRNGSEVSGLDCFWIIPSELENDNQIIQLQMELIGLQLYASEFALSYGYNVPEKIKDREIQDMAANNAEFRAKLTAEFGYDPLDYSWVEREMADDNVQRNWFKFVREHRGSLSDDWEKHVVDFKNKHHADVTIEEAFDMTLKWKRFLAGAWNTIAAQNPNIEAWKSAATKFEAFHRERTDRMMKWTLAKQEKYPMAKVIKPVHFRHGPYFNECIERVPKLFVDAKCYHLKEGVVLQVVSYDPETKHITLDFTPDVREKIKPGIEPNLPWRPLRADYCIYVMPDDIEEQLEFLDPLE